MSPFCSTQDLIFQSQPYAATETEMTEDWQPTLKNNSQRQSVRGESEGKGKCAILGGGVGEGYFQHLRVVTTVIDWDSVPVERGGGELRKPRPRLLSSSMGFLPGFHHHGTSVKVEYNPWVRSKDDISCLAEEGAYWLIPIQI